MVISPNGDFAYVAASGNNSIYQYSRDVNTGQLNPLTPASVSAGGSGRNPRFVAISNDGKFVYAPNFSNSDIGIYSRDTGTGLLTKQTAMVCGTQPFGIVLSPDTNNTHVYVSHGNNAFVSQFSRDAGTGALVALSPATVPGVTSQQGITISPDGASVYSCNNGGSISQYTRDTGTGLLNQMGAATVPSAGWPAVAVVSPDGKNLYVANDTAANIGIFTRDTGTGALSAVGTISGINGPYGIAITPDGKSIYIPGSDGNYIAQLTRDLAINTNGLPIKKVPFLVPSNPSASAIAASNAGPYGVLTSADGKFAYVVQSGEGKIFQFSIHP
jgi:6-phosphogluconolactonase (cycloisomerase 2 family)